MKYAIPQGLSQEQFSDWMDGWEDCFEGRRPKCTSSLNYMNGYGAAYAEEQKVTQESINENQ